MYFCLINQQKHWEYALSIFNIRHKCRCRSSSLLPFCEQNMFSTQAESNVYFVLKHFIPYIYWKLVVSSTAQHCDYWWGSYAVTGGEKEEKQRNKGKVHKKRKMANGKWFITLYEEHSSCFSWFLMEDISDIYSLFKQWIIIWITNAVISLLGYDQ